MADTCSDTSLTGWSLVSRSMRHANWQRRYRSGRRDRAGGWQGARRAQLRSRSDERLRDMRHSFDVAPGVVALTRATLAASEVVAKRDCGDATLTQTQALQERWCLGILH